MAVSQHYALVSGKVVFRRNESEDIEEQYINTTIVGDQPNITAVQIARAQQGIQMLLFQRIGVDITVLDVFIMSISQLGRMTNEKFMEGMDALQAGVAGNA